MDVTHWTKPDITARLVRRTAGKSAGQGQGADQAWDKDAHSFWDLQAKQRHFVGFGEILERLNTKPNQVYERKLSINFKHNCVLFCLFVLGFFFSKGDKLKHNEQVFSFEIEQICLSLCKPQMIISTCFWLCWTFFCYECESSLLRITCKSKQTDETDITVFHTLPIPRPESKRKIQILPGLQASTSNLHQHMISRAYLRCHLPGRDWHSGRPDVALSGR